MKREFDILRTALMFYTRIPVGQISGYSSDMLNHSTRYFPMIGIIVGGIGAGTYYGLQFILPHGLAILLSMVMTIWLTGAFHEDGFADVCDGFGGGYTPEKILEIMKDSRNGTYGTVGLVLMIGIKFFALYSLSVSTVVMALIAGHAFSRLFPVLMIYTSAYVRLDELSKAKPIGKKGSASTFVVALLFASLPLLLIELRAIIYVAPVMLIVFLIYRNYSHRMLGGYTGDVLGALQQLCELAFYLSLVAASK